MKFTPATLLAFFKSETAAWGLVLSWVGIILAVVPHGRKIQHYVSSHFGSVWFLYFTLACLALALLAVALVWWRARKPVLPNGVFWLAIVSGAGAVIACNLSSEESVHLVQYGVLAGLVLRAVFYRIHDASAYLITASWCFIFGSVDEFVQWLIPGRCFDFRDIRLNAFGSCLVLIGMAGVFRPAFLQRRPTVFSVRYTAALALICLTVVMAMLSNTAKTIRSCVELFPKTKFLMGCDEVMAEFGFLHNDPRIGRFKSRFTRKQLISIDASSGKALGKILRQYKEKSEYHNFLLQYTPLSDPFLHEARVRLFRRDEFLKSGLDKLSWDEIGASADFGVALKENFIMEKYCPHLLKSSACELDNELRAFLFSEAELRMDYVSPVSRSLITNFTLRQAAVVYIMAVAVLLVLQEMLVRRLRKNWQNLK